MVGKVYGYEYIWHGMRPALVWFSPYPQKHEALEEERPHGSRDEEQDHEHPVGIRDAPVQKTRDEGEEAGQVAGEE